MRQSPLMLILAASAACSLTTFTAFAQPAPSQGPRQGPPLIQSEDAELDEAIGRMVGAYIGEDVRLYITRVEAEVVAPADGDNGDGEVVTRAVPRVLFASAEDAEGNPMGQLFLHLWRRGDQPVVRMIRLPGGASAAPGLYAAPSVFEPAQLTPLDITGDLDLTVGGKGITLTVTAKSPDPMPTYEGGALTMTTNMTFGDEGLRIFEAGYDAEGEQVWTFPPGADQESPVLLDRRGEAPSAERRDSGLLVQVLEEPEEGATVGEAGDTYTVHYTGWLPNGQMFDSSRLRGQPFEIRIPGQVIQGWNEGLQGMAVGERRRLFIPPNLGYGQQGAGGVIPPNAWLVFDVEVLNINSGAASSSAQPQPQDDGHDHEDHTGHDHD